MILLLICLVVVVVVFGGIGVWALVASGQTREFDQQEQPDVTEDDYI